MMSGVKLKDPGEYVEYITDCGKDEVKLEIDDSRENNDHATDSVQEEIKVEMDKTSPLQEELLAEEVTPLPIELTSMDTNTASMVTPLETICPDLATSSISLEKPEEWMSFTAEEWGEVLYLQTMCQDFLCV